MARTTKQIVTQQRPGGTIHYVNRRDLEQRLDFYQRLSAHLVKLNKRLVARLEVRHGR